MRSKILKSNKVGVSIGLACIALLIWVLDLYTGNELGFFVFYFLPVALAAWYINISVAFFFAITCAALWCLAFILAANFSISRFLVIWNSATRLIAYLTIALTVSRLRSSFYTEKEHVKQLQEAISERIRVEESLRESEDRFRTMADGLPLIVWVHDAEGRQQAVNKTFLEFLGVSNEEIKGMRWKLLMHHEDAARYAGEFMACVRERRIFHSEVRVKRFDGEWRWVESWAQPRISSSGEYLGHVGTSADITERKKAEEALRQSETRYRVLHESMRDAFEQVAMDGRILECNDLYCKMLGYPPEEIRALTYQELTPERWHAYEAAIVQEQIIPRGYSDVYEKEYRRKDGTIIPVELRTILTRDENGQPSTMWATVRDITKRKRAEEELGLAYARLKTMFDHRIGGIGIAVSNAEGRVLHANDYLLNIFGCTREELLSGQVDWRGMTPQEWLPVDEYALEQLKKDNLHYPVEKEYMRRDGSRVPVLVTGVMMPGDSEEILSFILNITERKLMENALRQLNETLEQQVAERTAVAEARAKQLETLAMELIEAEERERRRLAELLHDDLQQVLSAALLQLEIGSDGLPPIAALEKVQLLLKESTIKARSLSHELSPALLHHSGLVPALQKLSLQMKDKFGLHVQLETKTDPKLDSMPAMVFLFRSVQELLFNVIKHAGVKIASIELSATDHDLTIVVSDKGQGFDQDAIDLPTSTGIGLMGLRERANYLGGNLKIESVLGNGSRFTLTIPLTPKIA